MNPTDDAATLAAKAKIQDAITRYSDLRASLRSAQVELDVAQAAFKYKYSVITPAEVPEKPKVPSPGLIAVLGLLAALLMAFATPAVVDLASAWVARVWRKSKLDTPLRDRVPPTHHFERTIFHVPWPEDQDQLPSLTNGVYEPPPQPPRLNR
jgi:hypothetical protein